MKTLTLALAVLALPAHAETRLTVMLDWFVNPDHAPIVLAQELGYFADAGWRFRPWPRPTPTIRRAWSPPGASIWPSAISRSCTCRATRACR